MWTGRNFGVAENHDRVRGVHVAAGDLAEDRAVQNLGPLGFGSVGGQAVDAGGRIEAFGGVQSLRRAGEVARLQIQRVGGIHVAFGGYGDGAATHDQRGAIPERRICAVSAGDSHIALLDVGWR
jgi:hypothetical protein